jgi:RNA polymerase sigma-70 factor (ECF subfamily)
MFAISPTNDSQTAARLLARARGGNREAFGDLVMPYTGKLRRLAFRLTGNDADADDICQEALLKAFLKLHQFTGTPGGIGDELHAWLRKIVKNVAIDLLRRNGNRKMISIDETSGDSEARAHAEIPSRDENPEEILSQRQSLNLFAAAIAELPRHLRQVCLLSDVLQYSTQEVATGLGITPMAVRTRLFRARGRLRMTLKPMFADGSF